MFAVPSESIHRLKQLHLNEYSTLLTEICGGVPSRAKKLTATLVRHLIMCLIEYPNDKDDKAVIRFFEVAEASNPRKWPTIQKESFDVRNSRLTIPVSFPTSLFAVENLMADPEVIRAASDTAVSQNVRDVHRDTLESAARSEFGFTRFEALLLSDQLPNAPSEGIYYQLCFFIFYMFQEIRTKAKEIADTFVSDVWGKMEYNRRYIRDNSVPEEVPELTYACIQRYAFTEHNCWLNERRFSRNRLRFVQSVQSWLCAFKTLFQPKKVFDGTQGWRNPYLSLLNATLDGLVADDRPLFWFNLWERFKAFEIVPHAKKHEKFITKTGEHILVLGRKEARVIPFLPIARAEALTAIEQELENSSAALPVDSSNQSTSASTSSPVPESRSALPPSQDNRLSSNVPAFRIRTGIYAGDGAFHAILRTVQPPPIKRKIGRPRKTPIDELIETEPPRKRGRPRKHPLPVPENNSNQ
jgi:hypothetical protein